MEKIERCMEEIWQTANSREEYLYIESLVTSDLETAVGKSTEEKKIIEIRRKTEAVLAKLREADQRLNKKMRKKREL